MNYRATIDSGTLAMYDADGLRLDAVAVIPDHAPDLARLVNMLSPEMAALLAEMADSRAAGMEIALHVC